MSDIQYNVHFQNLCNILQLGKLVGEPQAITGGLLHRMYAVSTTQGKYAVKALNPQIMIRPVARQNFINSERIVTRVLAHTIPALPAINYNGSFLQEVDNQFYLVFNWVEGISLKLYEINKVHCEKIGTILSEIHMADFSDLGLINNPPDHGQLTDWNYYLQKGQDHHMDWVNLLLENIDKLTEWNDMANRSTTMLEADMIISHRDLDPKNVMWNQDNPMLIDWESAGYIHPMQDLVETAIYWSENEMGNVDKERFFAFVGGYKKRYGALHANWSAVLANGFLGKLGWLEYSLKRSLWIECTDLVEQQLGTAQVTDTIFAIRRYAAMINELEEWLNNEL